MRVKETVFEGHRMLELDVASDTALIELAREQAALKYPHVHVDDPKGRPRDAEERFSQNFLGVVADLVCAKLLDMYFQKHQIDAKVTRYDDVREDNFRLHDEYDFKIQQADTQLYVEVRSSVCRFISFKRMIKEWHVLGPYASAVKGTSELRKHFYFRPLYHFTRTSTTGEYELSHGAQHLLDGHTKLYFVGGATEELLRRTGRQERGQELKQRGTDFWVVNILDGMDAPTLFEAVKARLSGGSIP